MRDPLHWMPVKHKLALLFASLCLLAYGVGGFLVSRSARTVLHEQITARIDLECRVSASALDEELRLLTRRTEDFASDGLIRERFEALQAAADGAEAEALGAELSRHLRENKLPLVAAFVELTLLSPEGEVLLGTNGVPPHYVADVARGSRAADGAWHSELFEPTAAYEHPLMAIATPLRSLRGGRDIGRLVAWLDPGEWVAGAWHRVGIADGHADPSLTLRLEDRVGRRLAVPAPGEIRSGSEAGTVFLEAADRSATGAPTAGLFTRSPRMPTNGWRVHLRLRSVDAFSPISGLQSRFLAVGIALALLTGVLLFFPMHFLVRPLTELRDAARRIRSGDYAVRVETRSDDEVGELARSFNHMAAAVEEQTRKLRSSADELRSRQREVRAERDRLDTILRSLRDGLVVLDSGGRPVLSNAAGRPLVALLEAGDPRLTSHYVCGEEDTADSAAGTCAACLVRTDAPPRSCVLDLGDRVYEIHAAALPPEPSGGRGRVLVARDITGRLTQDESHIHQERLSVLGEVAAVMAHELNNPLTAVRMFAQMLRDSLAPDSPYGEHVDVILRNTETCRRSIRELLGYATAGSPEAGAVDVHAVLRDVARFVRPLADRAGATVILDLGAREATITGDEIQLRQLFVNLVLNAVQSASDDVEVALRTRAEDDLLFVDVTDTGPGIPPGTRERIFDAFFTTKPRGEGTGLGLPTARRIAEMLGGGIDLVTAEPGGTTFRVRLRRRVGPAAVVEGSA